MAQIVLNEGAVPLTPSSGKVTLYAKTDGNLYKQDATGVEVQLGGSGGAAAVAWGSITGTISAQTDLTPAAIGAAPTTHTHTAANISDSTAAGRSLLTAADAAAQRTALGLGTAATTASTAYATAAQGTKADSALQPAVIGVAVQAYDADTAKTDVANTWSAEQTFKETKETVYALSGTAIDPANGTIQTKTLGANTTFTEALQSGQSVTLMITAGSYTVTWPTMSWVGGSAPTLATTGANVIVLWKVATTLYGLYVGGA